ncbi:hypothetical protein GGI15_002086 [Coemansia interrupta]|uniref:HMG box domain-containing protein n=1 Tax=Coemansia interrupta TaxID=1126814 RepID=A0A9W8HK09_9FUNG|nr:hypothetical protein GGI15_002086 [Coemansia interrupta]
MDPGSASAATPTKQGTHGLHQLGAPLRTPVRSVLERVSELTPQQKTPSFLAPFASPALRRLGEDALRDRLREAYQMLKEKERNLFLAATVGQQLVDANQQLQDDYDRVHGELAEAQSRMRDADGHEDRLFSTLHGRRKSMLLQQQQQQEKDAALADTGVDPAAVDSDSERQWIKAHLQPLKAQLQLAQERTDELLAEREDLAAEIYTLRQENTAALRRASEAMAVSDDAQQRIEKLEEDKQQLQQELDDQRTFWAKRWADLQDERKAGAEAETSIQQAAQRQAEDAAARLRAEKRADDLQLRANAAQAELELLRTQMQRMEEERVSEWEPMRERWLGCEEALQELQETHQSTCEALAQAEVRLAELDRSNEVSDPVKLKNERTSTSLLGELDYQRHKAVSEQQALARDHTVLKRAYTRSLNTQSRMKQQVSRLTQLAATGANEARMRRLEAALGEAECQQQALLWASMEHRRPAEIELSTLTVGGSDAGGTALVTALRARMKQTAAERDQLQRELRTAHLLRANEIQRTRNLERDAADTESRLHRVLGELSAVKLEYESLKRCVKTESKLSKMHVDAEASPSTLRHGDSRAVNKEAESGSFIQFVGTPPTISVSDETNQQSLAATPDNNLLGSPYELLTTVVEEAAKIESNRPTSVATTRSPDSLAYSAVERIVEENSALMVGPKLKSTPLTMEVSSRMLKRIREDSEATSVIKPKKPQNAFFLFRKDFHKEMQSSGSRLKAKDISELASKRWRTMEETMKSHYQKLADRDMASYQEASETYKDAVKKERKRVKKNAEKAASSSVSVNRMTHIEEEEHEDVI